MKPSLYLITPKWGKTCWGFDDAIKWINKKASTMPLGMATVASIAKKHCSEITLTDARFQKINYKTNADIVGISFYIMQKQEAFKIAERFRKLGKYVIMGGAHPTSNQDECKAYADTIFCGEAEYTISQFFMDFKNKKAKKIYRQIQKTDMKDSPVPAYHLLPMNKYFLGGVNYSRGCPFNCEFCDSKEEWFSGRKVRVKNSEQILKELDELKKFERLDSVFIHDDNFVGDIKAVKELLRHIVVWQNKNKYPFSFSAEASLNIAKDEELLDLFYKAGFISLCIGVETPNIDSLKISNKYQNASTNILKDIRKIQSYGIDVWAGMITGFDGDKKDIFERIFDFVQKSGMIVTSLGPLIVLDKTPLKERLIKEGRYKEYVDPYHPVFGSSKGKSLLDEATSATVNFRPLHMTDEELIEGTNWLLRQIYSHKNFAQRLKVLFNVKKKRKKGIVNSSVIYGVSSLHSLSTALYNIFLSSKEAFYYNIKLFLEVLLKKPSNLRHLIYYLGLHKSIFNFYKETIGNPDTVPAKCPVGLTNIESIKDTTIRLQDYFKHIKDSVDVRLNEFYIQLKKLISELLIQLKKIKGISKEKIMRFSKGINDYLEKIGKATDIQVFVRYNKELRSFLNENFILLKKTFPQLSTLQVI